MLVYISQIWLLLLTIVSLYHAILRNKSELWDVNSQLQKKKSELWNEKLQLPFLCFIQWQKQASIVLIWTKEEKKICTSVAADSMLTESGEKTLCR